MSGRRWYAVVDGARDPALHPMVMRTAAHQCLIGGHPAPTLAAALPWLVEMRSGEEIADRWRFDGWGQGWGILVESASGIDRLRLQFKRVLNALLPDGTMALFRFYDPVVFRDYLRIASAPERQPFFREANRYVVEGAAGERHDFAMQGGQLFDRGRAVT